MAQKSRPDPANGTIVTADEYEGISLGSFEDGVLGTPADTAVVYADSTGRQVKVRAGKLAGVRGYTWFSDPTTDEIINNAGAGLPANTSGNPRIDRLVLRLDRTARTIRTVYLQGTAAVTPAAPTLTQNTGLTSGLWDFPLARWNVANGYTTIAAADIVTEAWYRAPGGGVALCTTTSRPFGAYLYSGLEIYETDTTVTRQWNGTVWLMTSPYRQEIILANIAPNVVISNIPTFLRRVRVTISAKSDYTGVQTTAMYMQVNNVNATQYSGFRNSVRGTAGWISSNYSSQTIANVGEMPGSFFGGFFGQNIVEFTGWSRNDRQLMFTYQSIVYTDQANSQSEVGGGIHHPTLPSPGWTSLKFFPNQGSFNAGTEILLEGWD